MRLQGYPDKSEPLGIARFLARPTLELCLPASIVAAFLATYVHVYHGSAAAVAPHIYLVATMWIGCVGLRFILCASLRGDTTIRWANASVVAVAVIVLAVCEIGFLIGLSSWGRIPTWPLLKIYVLQASDLLESMGLSQTLVCAASILFIMATIVVLSRGAAAIHWVIPVARRARISRLFILCFMIAILVSVRLYSFAASPPVQKREPFSLMFFPEQGVRAAQTRSTPAQLYDTAELDARVAYVPSSRPRKRNVILIVGDALRPDRLSVNGYSRLTTPYIQSLVASGRARSLAGMVSVCAESSCGLKGIAQSRYAHQFPREPLTLYEVLRLHDYSVRLILSGDHTNFYELRDSYGTVDSYVDGTVSDRVYVNDDRLVVENIRALPRWDGKPVMMQLHLMSSHALGKRYKSFEQFRPFANYARIVKKSDLSHDEIERAQNFYDNGVLQFDARVRETVEALAARGYLEDAIVVITADHGEMLGEHGVLSHGFHVYDEVLRVPFVVADFGDSSFLDLHCSRIFSQIDIAPTILHALNIPAPSTWKGVPLQREYSRDYIFFQQGAQVGLFDLVHSPDSIWKYWVNLLTGEQLAFDLSKSDLESTNEIEDVKPAVRTNWRLAVMSSAASVALTKPVH